MLTVFSLITSLAEALDFETVISSGRMRLDIYGMYDTRELNLNWVWEKYGGDGGERWQGVYSVKQKGSRAFHMVANGVDMGRIAEVFGKRNVDGCLDCELEGVLSGSFFEILEGNFVIEDGVFGGKAMDALFPSGASDKLRQVFVEDGVFAFQEALGVFKKVGGYIIADTTFYTPKGSLHQTYRIKEDELKAVVEDFMTFIGFGGGGLK